MRFAVIPIVLSCVLYCTLPAYSAEDEHAGLVARVVKLDGLDKAFDAIPAVFDSIAGQQQLVSPHASEEQQIYSEVRKAIDLDGARKALTGHLESNADDETLKAVLIWLESPLGRKISAEEINAATEADPTAMQRYLASLRSDPPPRERIELMQRFVAQKRMAEALAKITRHVTIAMLTGLSEGGGCPPEDPADIEATLKEYDERLVESMRQQSILSTIYAYRKLTDDEIEQYLRQMTADSYLKYDRIIREALDISLGNLYRAIGKKMAEKRREINPGEEGCYAN